MSIDTPVGAGSGALPEADVDTRRGPKPAAHGSATQAVFNGVDLDLGVPGADRDATLYDAVLNFWRENVETRDREPYPVAELDPDGVEWLPEARDDRDYILELTSSSWKAGVGTGDDYRAYYKYDVKLREVDDDGETHSPPLSVHLKIMPQYEDLVYPDGEPLSLPYGEGTRVTCQTTWAESAEAVERRMVDVLEALVGADADRLELARNDDSRRLAKAEAHVRFDIGYKRQVVETVEQTKQLIAYGGESELDAHQTRQAEGWLEAAVDADRWHLLGFPETDYNIKLKVYQAAGWADYERNNPFHHPKLEASFSGVNGNGALPHVDEWDETLQVLRDVVSTHLDWSAVGREDLVEDDFFDGPHAPDYSYRFPSNRREQLRERYENVATEIFREATKANTQAVYDILRVLAEEKGATYDVLEQRTGLARSSVRRHVRRLVENGVADRVGNPVLVIFPSWEVLERAGEIMRQVYPDDTLDDMNERAEERRERRENGEWGAPPGDDRDDRDDGAHDGADDGADDGASSSTWRYFEDLSIEPHQLANALEREYLTGNEVRVRVDRREWIG